MLCIRQYRKEALNMKLIADLHSHTLMSGHAFGTIREMAQAAADMNLPILGITEHAPGIPGTVHPIYFWNLRCVPKELFGVRVPRGRQALSGRPVYRPAGLRHRRHPYAVLHR